jgi:hypothetical protein
MREEILTGMTANTGEHSHEQTGRKRKEIAAFDNQQIIQNKTTGGGKL